MSTRNMKAWILKNVGDIRQTSVPIRELKEDEVLVAVRACGVCGSDIPRIYNTGAHNMPLIIGHEFSGEVVETGSKAYEKLLKKRVGVFPLIPCKTCKMCRRKAYALCEAYDYLGSRSDGGFAEYVVVPVWNLIDLPDNISFEAAAMLEPMAVALHAARRVFTLAEADKDERIVISGLGTIGLLLNYILQDKGYKNILLIGNKDIQKELAQGSFVDIRNGIPEDVVKDTDVYFDAVGSNASISLGLKVLKAHGRMCLIGNPHSDMFFKKEDYWQILRKELAVAGTWNSSFKASKDDWQDAISILSEDAKKYEKLITHRFNIDNIEEGFLLMRDKSEEYVKVMMVN